MAAVGVGGTAKSAVFSFFLKKQVFYMNINGLCLFLGVFRCFFGVFTIVKKSNNGAFFNAK